MKNFLLPLLAGLLIGSVASYVILNMKKNKECFVCISKDEFKQENLIDNSPSSLKQSLLKSLDFTSTINQGYDEETFKTRRIDEETAQMMRAEFNEGCSEVDQGVIFELKPLLNALMDAKGIQTIESIEANELEKLGLITVFARYPNPFPDDPDKNHKYTSIIQFGVMSGSTISDVFYRNTQEVIKYNFGTLCPDTCPPSIDPDITD